MLHSDLKQPKRIIKGKSAYVLIFKEKTGKKNYWKKIEKN